MARNTNTWCLLAANRNEAIKRFVTAAQNAPTGHEELDRCQTALADDGYLVVETNDSKNIRNWLHRTSDLRPNQVEPVITDEEQADLS